MQLINLKIKKFLKDLIINENKKKPLTDTNLTKELNRKGYPVARRTVAKYREILNIPSSSERRRKAKMEMSIS